MDHWEQSLTLSKQIQVNIIRKSQNEHKRLGHFLNQDRNQNFLHYISSIADRVFSEPVNKKERG